MSERQRLRAGSLPCQTHTEVPFHCSPSAQAIHKRPINALVVYTTSPQISVGACSTLFLLVGVQLFLLAWLGMPLKEQTTKGYFRKHWWKILRNHSSPLWSPGKLPPCVTSFPPLCSALEPWKPQSSSCFWWEWVFNVSFKKFNCYWLLTCNGKTI